MLGTYDYKFILPGGKQVFVPSEKGRERGEQIKNWVANRWEPPGNFFHLNVGGHVAAARSHIADHVFGKLDLADFFDTVTRSKVQRSLRKLGFKHSEAWEDARDSTVEKTVGASDFSIPYGFVQSPILASLALNNSALGTLLEQLPKRGIRTSVYVDDIVLSSSRDDLVGKAMLDLCKAAAKSNFRISPAKIGGPAAAIEVFNIIVSHGSLSITQTRMADFEAAVGRGAPAVTAGILGYLDTVNADQAQYLRSVADDRLAGVI